VYLDDILVYSPSVEQHEKHLRLVLQRLRDSKLYAKMSKCSFGDEKVEYLGHWVGQGTRWMDPGKVTSILEWPVPQNVKAI